LQRDSATYERLDPADCIRAYGVDFLAGRRHVIVVTQVEGVDNSVLGTLDWSYNLIQNPWICGTNVTNDMVLQPHSIDDFDCTVQEALATLPMTIANKGVNYCLSQRVPDVCRLQFSLPIMLIVIFCNVVKLMCILLTLMRNESPLIMMGDAISSFLQRPDPMTKGMGPVTIYDLRAGYWPIEPQARPWVYRRYWRWQSVGLWRWIITNAL
jgi:hypothetical protein